MKRKKPSFNESYHGYRTFSDLLEDAEKEGILRLKTDPRSGTYVVEGFGKEQRRGEAEELKESKVRKGRTPQKPRWRSQQRRKETAPAPPPATPETVSPEPNAPEAEPAI